MKKFFDLLKKIFNVDSVDAIDDAMIDAYYAESEEVTPEAPVEEVKEEVVNAAPETEKEEEKVTETEEVKETEPEEVKEEEKPTEEKPAETEEVKEEEKEEKVTETEEVKEEVVPEVTENKKDDVIDEEVVNKALDLNTKSFDKDYLNNLHGDEFFKVLRSNPAAVKDAYRG